MRPVPQTWLVSIGAGLVLELAVGAIAAATSLTGRRLDTLGLVALALTTLAGAAWHRRRVPGATWAAQALAALPVPVVLAALSFVVSHRAGGGARAADGVLVVVAVLLGLVAGDGLGRLTAAPARPGNSY